MGVLVGCVIKWLGPIRHPSKTPFKAPFKNWYPYPGSEALTNLIFWKWVYFNSLWNMEKERYIHSYISYLYNYIMLFFYSEASINAWNFWSTCFIRCSIFSITLPRIKNCQFRIYAKYFKISTSFTMLFSK